MDNPNETVVDKAVNFVKDVFGIPHDGGPEVTENAAYPETEPEAAADDAMKLDPNAFIVNTAGQITPNSYATPTNENALPETDAERLRREVDEYPRQKTASELNEESAWHEDNG